MTKDIISKKIIKKEKIILSKEVEDIIDSLDNYHGLFDPQIIKKVGKDTGFQSEDAKIYKLVGALTENLLEDILDSINHIDKKEISLIGKKIVEAKEDDKLPNKKLVNLQNNLMSDRVLNLKDLISELNDRNIKINKWESIPFSNINN